MRVARGGIAWRSATVVAALLVFGCGSDGAAGDGAVVRDASGASDAAVQQDMASASVAPLPPGMSVEGKSQAEWGAAWWAQMLALPMSGHPFFQAGGNRC